MSSGKPDWYTSAVLTGKYDIQFLPVAVDGEGNIKAVLQGSSLIAGDVNATDLNTIKQIQGIEGATYRTIAVDSLGQLIAVMKSAAGNNVLVDASGFLSAVLKGTYSAPGDKNIAVDGDGRLIAMVKALYGSTVKDVQSDANGNLTLNIKAQDLLEIINRNKYGAAKLNIGYRADPPPTKSEVISVAGKGIIYGGTIEIINGTEAEKMIIDIDIDSEQFESRQIQNIFESGITGKLSVPILALRYDTVNQEFTIKIPDGVTFENSFTISVTGVLGSFGTLTARVYYALL